MHHWIHSRLRRHLLQIRWHICHKVPWPTRIWITAIPRLWTVFLHHFHFSHLHIILFLTHMIHVKPMSRCHLSISKLLQPHGRILHPSISPLIIHVIIGLIESIHLLIGRCVNYWWWGWVNHIHEASTRRRQIWTHEALLVAKIANSISVIGTSIVCTGGTWRNSCVEVVHVVLIHIDSFLYLILN